MKPNSGTHEPSFVPQKKGRKNFLGRTLIKGLLVALPIIIVAFLFSVIYRFVDKSLKPISKLFPQEYPIPDWAIHILALLILLAAFFIIGLLVSSKAGIFYFRKIEHSTLDRLPFYSMVRDSVTQFSELKEMPFSRAVLIDPYRTGHLMTGFVTEEVDDTMITVFVPTAPNPTNGLIFHVPVKEAREIEAGSKVAMRTVISMGSGSRFLFREAHPDLVEQAQKALDESKSKR